jgi:signal transduction histidine kinase
MNTLATGFNSMAERLHDTIQEQQILIGAIPHELRSPLGRVRFALDLTRNRDTVEQLREDIDNIDRYVDDMQLAVDEILELNRLQNKQTVESNCIALCPLVNDLVRHHQSHTSSIILDLQCDNALKVVGNASLLRRAVQNVIENAARHARSKINVKVWQQDSKTYIQVDDDGEGIPADKIDSIFVPFLTLDSSRNRKSGGIGLGLALVRIIMTKHGGNVAATQSMMGGACFTLSWK